MKEAKEPKEIGFVFEEIAMQDALTVIASGDGKYSDLIIMLSKKLPELEKNNMNVPASERKSFSFGLPGGKELEERDRRKLCNSANLRLRRGGINWKIHYSGNRKVFICVPTKAKNAEPENSEPRYSAKRTYNIKPRELTDEETQALALRAQGLSYSKIAAKMGILESRVSYICGKKPKKLQKSMAEENGEMPTNAHYLVDVARKLFNITQDGKAPGNEGRLFRKAVSVVGVRDFHIRSEELGRLIGISGHGVKFNASSPGNFAADEIKKLRAALHIIKEPRT